MLGDGGQHPPVDVVDGLVAVARVVHDIGDCRWDDDGGSNGGSAASDKPLVVGYSNFSSKFSPFFSETAYDQDVYAMTQIGLITTDRQGAVIYNGIEGETIPYNGTDYTYYGPADCVVTENVATGV